MKTASVAGGTIEYVEVTREDIALANRLAHEVLGRSLDDLPPQTRRLLTLIVGLVEARSAAQAIPRDAVRFTRRELREAVGWGDTQVKLHLSRLVEHEYLIVHRHGPQTRYELAFDGDPSATGRQLVGLLDVAALQPVGTTADRPGLNDDRSGSESDQPALGRPPVGVWSGVGRGDETAPTPCADAGSSSLVAASKENPLPGPGALPRRSRNGSAAVAVR